ncbi:MAG TPA: hypothetical protein VGC27_12590, partial [Rhizomicrobium sp.]
GKERGRQGGLIKARALSMTAAPYQGLGTWLQCRPALEEGPSLRLICSQGARHEDHPPELQNGQGNMEHITVYRYCDAWLRDINDSAAAASITG